MPPAMKHAGVMVLPDILLPLPMVLLALAATLWVIFAPALIIVGAGRGHLRRNVGMYATGVLAVAIFFTFLSGMGGQSLAERIPVWARYIWLQIFGLATALGIAALCIIRLRRRSLSGQRRPDATAP